MKLPVDLIVRAVRVLITLTRVRATVRIGFVAVLVFGIAGPTLAQMPPPQAANAGFVVAQLNQDFTKQTILSLSCDGGTDRASTKEVWHMGLWWENPSAPCSQATLSRDSSIGSQVLDLAWLASQSDTYDATSISTMARNYQSFTGFRHGYYEAIYRVTPFNKPGIWPVFWLWDSASVLFANNPPWQSTNIANEIDISETNTTGGVYNWFDSAVHAWGTGAAGFIHEGNLPNFDYTKYHKYGLLWTGNGLWKAGTVCTYIDDVQQGCATTDATAEASDHFLILSMGVGCNWQFGNRSCLSGLSRVDMLVRSVRVWSCAKDASAAGC